MKKLIFFYKFFCLLLSEGTFTSFFKDKKSKRSHKTVGINVFLLFLLDDKASRSGVGYGPGSIPLTCGSGSGGPKTCGSGSATLLRTVSIQKPNLAGLSY
jgi:hypothetical protein